MMCLPPVIIQGTWSQKIKAKLAKLLRQRLFLGGQRIPAILQTNLSLLARARAPSSVVPEACPGQTGICQTPISLLYYKDGNNQTFTTAAITAFSCSFLIGNRDEFSTPRPRMVTMIFIRKTFSYTIFLFLQQTKTCSVQLHSHSFSGNMST